MLTIIRKNKVALAVAVIFTALSLSFLLPPEESTIVWASRIRLLTIIIPGWLLQLPPVLFLRATDSPALSVVVFPVYWFAIGLLIQRVLPLRRLDVPILVTFGLILGGLSLCGAIFANSVDEPYASCEKQVSVRTRISIIAHHERGWMGGVYFFFLQSDDGGTTRRQFTYQYLEFDALTGKELPNCGSIKSLGDRLFWAWSSGELFMTRDGGSTWRTIKSWEWHNWQKNSFRDIQDVQFQDPESGYMTLVSTAGDSTLLLKTEDGGLTWH